MFDIFSKLLPLIRSPCIVSIHCLKCTPPKRQRYELEPNVSGYPHWISFVSAKTGWLHKTTGVWPGFKQAIVCLIISMQWYWVDNAWTGFGTMERTALIPFKKTFGILSEWYLDQDIMLSISFFFVQPRLIFQFFRSYDLPIIKVLWNIYHNTWSV